MADIAAVKTKGERQRNEYFWEAITHSDDGAAVLVEAGEYMVNCEGDWTGSMQIDIEIGKQEANVTNPDTTNLQFTGNGSYGLKVGRCYVKPTRSNGSSGADVDVSLIPIV